MAARRRERDQRRFEQLIEQCDVARKARDYEKADTIRTEMHILAVGNTIFRSHGIDLQRKNRLKFTP